ncbi:MAG: general secretion pathway protein GspK [Candidatus Kuenenia sp.]|nr:general secretion pathway protein GspK [Candidatus Kuenenia hertensis]
MEGKNYRKNPEGNKINGNKKWGRTSAYNTNHGYVLVFSLWTIVVIGFIALSFTRNTGTAIKTELAFTERVRNIYAARGACIYAIKMILTPEKQREKEEESKKRRNKTKNTKGKNEGQWMPGNEPYSVVIGDRNCDVYISDESGKININKITDETRPSFIKFLLALKIEEHDAEIITDSILDWVDDDDLHHVNGAEKNYYGSLPEPYEPKNGSFEIIEELTLVRGITSQIYELLRDHVTIYGSDKINVNFASKEVLLYVPDITPEVVDAILQYRDENGKIEKFRELKELFRGYGIIGSYFQEVTKYLTVYDSNFLTIHSIAYPEESGNFYGSYKIIVRKGSGDFNIIAVYPD